MNYELPAPLQRLRSELRRRIATAFPDGFPSIFVDDPAVLDASAQFCRRLGEDGLLTMAWPPEYGGTGASLWAQAIVAEEMWAHGEPRGAQYYGVNWIGPAIMRFGTPAQRALHLPMIARGEALWAQGYSEPDAGSDLASLRLRARRVAGGWELSGQKIWTSYASFARWCFLAARTDDSGSKHHGVTVFLVPMDREGIEVRPIASVNSPHDLNEVFFDQAFASDDEVLGNVDHGWQVITASLTFERVGTARYARSDRLLSEARTAMLEDGKQPSRQLVANWVDAAINTRVARLLTYRAVAERERAGDGSPSPLASSVSRIANTVNDQATTSEVLEMLGPSSLLAHGEQPVPVGGEAEHEWRHALSATVVAGTREVQQMVIAREVLGPTRRGR
jgi:alkylation response protein AidB-like acyl-CoA dehydrogenase